MSRTCGRLYACDTVLKGLAQHHQEVATELRRLIQKEHPVVRQRYLLDSGTCPPPISPTAEIVWWGARNGRVVTKAVRSPGRPATRWMRVMSMASGRVSSGRMVVCRCPSSVVKIPLYRDRRNFSLHLVAP
jgi:hypothetical protein